MTPPRASQDVFLAHPRAPPGPPGHPRALRTRPSLPNLPETAPSSSGLPDSSPPAALQPPAASQQQQVPNRSSSTSSNVAFRGAFRTFWRNYLCGCAQAAQGLDEGQCVNIAIFWSVVLVMFVVVSILVLSSNFRCDWRSRKHFLVPGVRKVLYCRQLLAPGGQGLAECKTADHH